MPTSAAIKPRALGCCARRCLGSAIRWRLRRALGFSGVRGLAGFPVRPLIDAGGYLGHQLPVLRAVLDRQSHKVDASFALSGRGPHDLYGQRVLALPLLTPECTSAPGTKICEQGLDLNQRPPDYFLVFILPELPCPYCVKVIGVIGKPWTMPPA